MITALGAVSPAGRGVEALWSALSQARDLVRPIAAFDTAPYECKTAALVPGARSPEAFLDDALDEALAAAGPRPAGPVGLAVGTTLGGNPLLALAADPDDASPVDLARVPYHGLTDGAARRLAVSLPPATVSGACASSLIALGLAFLWIRSGRAARVVAAGYDCHTEFVHAGFSALKALTAERVRPFDRDRSGIVLGEGAGVLVLEEAETAREGGRKPLAEVRGFSCRSDANHITGPHPDGDGLFRTIEAATAMARVNAYDYVVAHGTGTVYNDRMESLALARALGPRVPPASSVKSMMGHTLGAAGALETIAAVLALNRDTALPTIHFRTPDPECVADPVAGKARPLPMEAVLKTAAGFGGQNAALALTRWRP